MSYIRTAVRGTGWIIFFHFAAAVISYATRVTLARTLTPAEYGLFYAVFGLVTFTLFFRDLGVAPALAKYIPEYRVHQQWDYIKTMIASVTLIQMVGSMLISIVLFFLADTLAVNYFRTPEASLMLKILIGYIIGSLFFRLTRAVLQGFQSLFLFAAGEFLKNLIAWLLIILFFHMGYRTQSPALAFALVCPIVVLIDLPFLLKDFNFFKHNIVEFKTITKKVFIYSLPLFATAITDKLFSQLDTVMLTYFRTTTEVGIYNSVLPTAQMLLIIGTSAAIAFFPISAELQARNDMKKLAEGIRLLFRYIFFISIPAIMPFFIYAQYFIEAVFGREYLAGVPSLQVLLFGTLFLICATININIISALGSTKAVAKITFMSSILDTITNLIFIPPFGVFGAAATTAVSYAFVFGLSAAKVKTLVETKLPIKSWLKLVIPTASMGAIMYFLPKMMSLRPLVEMALSFFVGLLVYSALSILLKIIDVKEIKRYGKIVIRPGNGMLQENLD